MKTLNVEHLQVESFETQFGDTVSSNSVETWCTQIDCPSQDLGCTERCIAPSGKTDDLRCCG
jgi:hypothetical protein